MHTYLNDLFSLLFGGRNGGDNDHRKEKLAHGSSLEKASTTKLHSMTWLCDTNLDTTSGQGPLNFEDGGCHPPSHCSGVMHRDYHDDLLTLLIVAYVEPSHLLLAVWLWGGGLLLLTKQTGEACP